MAHPILMPQVGQDLTEGVVVELLVKLGDEVKKGDIVAVVESEKASFEVEAFAEGTVLSLPYAAGDTAPVLEPLMMVGEPGEVLTEDTGANGAATEPAAQESAAPVVVDKAPTTAPANGRLRVSPVARRLALQHGIDLGSVSGSGPRGSIVMRDLKGPIEENAKGPTPAAAPATSPVRDGGRLNLRTMRDGPGAPLVLVHGFGGDLSVWRGFLNHLPTGRGVVVLDLPAHGGSVHEPADGFDALVTAVGDALLEARMDSAHLVGHSLGAAVCAAVAASGTIDARSLTLIAPAGLSRRINAEFVSGFCAARTEDALSTWMSVLVHDTTLVSGTLVRATARARADDALVEAQARLAEAIFPGGTQRFSVRDAVERFAGPVRAIVGLDDAIVDPPAPGALPAHVAVHHIPNAGHVPMLETPALVGRLIAESVRSAG
ncbi:MAG: alpha/beta fold hydrolase [Pseudomonadota bacterium]